MSPPKKRLNKQTYRKEMDKKNQKINITWGNGNSSAGSPSWSAFLACSRRISASSLVWFCTPFPLLCFPPTVPVPIPLEPSPPPSSISPVEAGKSNKQTYLNHEHPTINNQHIYIRIDFKILKKITKSSCSVWYFVCIHLSNAVEVCSLDSTQLSFLFLINWDYTMWTPQI